MSTGTKKFPLPDAYFMIIDDPKISFLEIFHWQTFDIILEETLKDSLTNHVPYVFELFPFENIFIRILTTFEILTLFL